MYEKFKDLADERDVSAYRVAKDLGFSQSLFSDWKAGRSKPKQDKIQMIADYFGVPISYFYENQPEPKHQQVFEAAAGQGRLNEGYEVDDAVLTNDEYSQVRIVGDSMLPTLQNGDLILVHHITDVLPHDFAMVKVNGDEVTCKHVEVTNEGIWLRAENKDVFEDRFYSVQEIVSLPVTIIGKAVRIVSRDL